MQLGSQGDAYFIEKVEKKSRRLRRLSINTEEYIEDKE
jgi:hypothetical protein